GRRVAGPRSAGGRPRIPSTIWMFGGAFLAMVAFALIFLTSLPGAESGTVSAKPTIAPSIAAPAVPATPAAPEAAVVVIATPVPEVPTAAPTAAPPVAPTRPARAPSTARRPPSPHTLPRP